MSRDLKADLELCQATTPGQWEVWDFDCSDDECGERMTGLCIMRDGAPDKMEMICNFGIDPTDQDYKNAKAIVEAHNGGWTEAIQRALAAEERVSELEAAIRKAIEALDDHDHEPVYGPHGLKYTQCVAPNGKLCQVLDDLRDTLGEEANE